MRREAGAQRRRPRRPDQHVALVQRAQQALHLARPALGRVGPVLGRAERVVGHEHLRAVVRPRGPDLLRPRALVRLPPVGHQGERDHPRHRRLAHLRRPGEDGEAMAPQHGERAGMGADRHEHACQGLRLRRVERRRGAGDRRTAERRRMRGAQLARAVERLEEPAPPEHAHPVRGGHLRLVGVGHDDLRAGRARNRRRAAARPSAARHPPRRPRAARRTSPATPTPAPPARARPRRSRAARTGASRASRGRTPPPRPWMMPG